MFIRNLQQQGWVDHLTTGQDEQHTKRMVTGGDSGDMLKHSKGVKVCEGVRLLGPSSAANHGDMLLSAGPKVWYDFELGP